MKSIYYNWIRPTKQTGENNMLVKLDETEETWGYFIDLETNDMIQCFNHNQFRNYPKQIDKYRTKLYTIYENPTKKQYVVFVSSNTWVLSLGMAGIYILIYILLTRAPSYYG